VQTRKTVYSQKMRVSGEPDVIGLRQLVRQVAREWGMGLTQQARLTAATSALARAMVGAGNCPTIALEIARNEDRFILEIGCVFHEETARSTIEQIEQAIPFTEIHELVDEVCICDDEAHRGLRLKLHILLDTDLFSKQQEDRKG
jgi:hypothetical protein